MTPAFFAGFSKDAMLLPLQPLRAAKAGLRIGRQAFVNELGHAAAGKLKPGVSMARKMMDLADKTPRQHVSMPRGGWTGGGAPADPNARLLEMLQKDSADKTAVTKDLVDRAMVSRLLSSGRLGFVQKAILQLVRPFGPLSSTKARATSFLRQQAREFSQQHPKVKK